NEDQLTIALEEGEVAKGTMLKLVAADAQINALGFGPADSDTATVEQTAVLVARYDTEDFFVELGNALGASVAYSAAQQVYTYHINFALTALPTVKVPFSFAQELGPIGSVSLNGQLLIDAKVSMDLTLGLDLGAREVQRLLSSSTV